MPIRVLYVSEHMKKTFLVEVERIGYNVHVENGSMRSVLKIVNQIGMVIHDFVLTALNNIRDNVVVIFSIIILLLLHVRDTVYKSVVVCILLYR